MELFISGLALGLVFAYMVKWRRDRERERLEELLTEANDLIDLQDSYIKQGGKNGARKNV